MQNLKEFKRGEYLFKEGQPADYVYLIQSGRVSLNVERNNKKSEILKVLASHFAGDQQLVLGGKHTYSAVAEVNTKAIEIPISKLKPQLDSLQGVARMVLKSLADHLKAAAGDIKKFQMEKDGSPCPQLFIPRIFGILGVVGQVFGKKLEDGRTQIDWPSFKVYAIRMFTESAQRLENACYLLVKLGHAEIEMRKRDDEEDSDEEELYKVTFNDINFVESFADFYQYNFFKPGKNPLIHPDPQAASLVAALVDMAKDIEVDFRGAVKFDFDWLVETMKKEYRLIFKLTHLDLFQTRGLLAQKVPQENGVAIAFDKEEFTNVSRFWTIIQEIEKWNERGFVKMEEEAKEELDDGLKCPGCDTVVTEEMKFCSECGAKLAA
jgi:hypothetical protein